jgi:hypothetical protein
MSKSSDAAITRDENMAIWDRVEKTDPAHTKPVSFGRKFTAIDAHYQVQRATEIFGPVGQDWGYSTKFSECHTEEGEIIQFCDLTFWWIGAPNDPCQFGPVRGACILKKKGKVPDTDAGKKAMTDALTKCLSHLGFNADVFLGKFDDNKYVNELKKDKDAEADAAHREYEQTRKGFIEKIKACGNADAIDGVLLDYKLWIDRLSPSKGVEIRAWAEKQKGEKNGS